MSKFLKGLETFGRGVAETAIGTVDGAVKGLTGLDMVGDDFYQTDWGKGLNSTVEKAAPMIAGVAAGVATANPAVGMKVYQGANQLSSALNPPEEPVQQFQEGGAPMPSMLVNIEKGELVVDRATGNIIEDLESYRYKPHNKNKKKEDPNNFIELPEGSFIVPKKDADKYRKNPHLREGIIRNVSNLQKERMIYGKDSNGNVQEYNKLAPQAFAGLDPTLVPGLSDIFSYGNYQAPQGFTPSQMPVPNFNDDYHKYAGNMTGNQNAPTVPDAYSNLYKVPGMSNSSHNNYNYNGGTQGNIPQEGYQTTPGDYVGYAGNIIGGLGPLATTLKMGMDTDETNTMMGVGKSAMSQYASTLGRSREESMRTLRGMDRTNRNNIRNASSNFSSMSARNQASSNLMQQNVGRTGLQYDLPLAQGLSQMNFQADSMERQGELGRQDRLDRNRDNYYSNLSSNLSNLGTMTSSTGQQMNKQRGNETQLNILKQISPYFEVDEFGVITFKGEKLNK